MRRSAWFVAVLFGLVGGACEGGGASGSRDDLADLPGVVTPGKEDNFLSESAQEYLVEGTTTVTIEESLATADEETKLARVRELVGWKHVVIGWFLNAYVVDKGHDAGNQSYGGFKALTKNGSYADLGLKTLEDGRTYEFTFRQELGGQLDLLSSMGLTPDADGNARFELTIGRVSNDEMARLDLNSEWYRSAPWSEFDPAKVDASRLDKIALTIRKETRSADAWFDYERLFADGELAIDIFFGWDYHSEYHLKHSRSVYDWLIGQGFTSPVTSYDAYGPDSGPLTRTIQADGKPVTVDVRLYWCKAGSATLPDCDTAEGGRRIESLMRESFRTREVVGFSGHSGPFYAFALANWRKTDEGDLDDSEIPGLDMPRDTYQIVLAEGCETYAVGQAFWMNPNKPNRSNLDVITTTNFSNASTPATVQDFLTAVVGTDERGVHQPKRFRQLLADLDSNSSWFDTMYGVHGLDDNPHLHPYADAAKLCTPCTDDRDCTAQGMQCTRVNQDEAVCTAECTADDGCPAGYSCQKVAYGSWIEDRHCVPANDRRSCAAIEAVATPPAILINEVLAGPSEGNEGDANGDGLVDATADEFVELLNTSEADVDLAGWTLGDGTSARLVFPANSVLPAGKALLVFGGGAPTAFGELGGALVLVAGEGLSLDDASDVVVLTDARGAEVDRVQWGGDATAGVSLVRERDGDRSAPLVAHPVVAHSAGLDQQGAAF